MLRKRIKKKKPLKLFTKQKLHSKTSKSTYFYTKWFLDRKTQASNPANGFRVSLSSLRENSESPEVPSAIQTRLSRKVKNPYGGITRLGSTYFLPVACSLALLLVAGLAINPFAQEEGGGRAYAAINEDLGNGSTISLAIYNNGSEVADNGAVSTNVNAGQVSYISNLIKVTTNKIGKYYIGIQAASDGTSELVGRDYNATIAGVGSNVNPDSFGDNTWGYALTDNTSTADQNLAYSTLPAYSASTTPQYASMQNPDNGEHELKLTFAAKIRADKPADHYQTTTLVSVAAEAKAIPSWQDHGLSTMQGMTSGICTAAEEGTTGQLTDTRDSKTYWVTKLKDGNCWMTQNLALDLSTSKALTSADSDVTSSWTPANSTDTTATALSAWGTDNAAAKSYNPGEYIYNTPTVQTNCGESGITSLAQCTEVGWSLATGLSKDTSNNTQTHYLVGNYYTYSAATANTAPSGVGLASSSICPKGWQLPRSNSSSGDKCFNTLFTQYGEYDNALAYGSVDIRTSPLYFFYGGYIENTYLSMAGSEGRYWSASSTNNGLAYMLYMGSTVNGIKTPAERHIGMTIRCVAR